MKSLKTPLLVLLIVLPTILSAQHENINQDVMANIREEG